MDDTQRIVKCGNLSLHTPGGFFKKRWHSKYLVLYDGSKSGVKRLELFDSEIKFKKQNPAKIIPLVDCVRVVTCQRHKTTYTFEVRTSDQFYLLAAQSFQDMNDWVNCLRLVAFGQSSPATQCSQPGAQAAAQVLAAAAAQLNKSRVQQQANNGRPVVDVLLEKRTQQQVATSIERTADYVRSLEQQQQQSKANLASLKQVSAADKSDLSTQVQPPAAAATATVSTAPAQVSTASQAAAAAASALAKTRQRQPSLLGSCKPQPPTDSPFIQVAAAAGNANVPATINQTAALSAIGGQIDTLTPTVRGQLISSALAGKSGLATSSPVVALSSSSSSSRPPKQPLMIQSTLDEEEENMLYCSIEDNPSEHNYRVKVIETELSLRCQLKCYQLTAPTTISQQYEQLGHFSAKTGAYLEPSPVALGGGGASSALATSIGHAHPPPVTFYQLIIGPQELTLLNDYAAVATLKRSQAQQQGLWSWPYQCIRRYGFDKDNCFMFEAGRKCTSGPGQFIVQTPKAYQIYQDVVKFVNELRSLGGSGGAVGTLATGNAVVATTATQQSDMTSSNVESQLITATEQPQSRTVVTQIPVTWAPASTATSGDASGATRAAGTKAINNNTTAAPQDSRQQFFNTLRQLESSSGGNLQPTTTAAVAAVSSRESATLIAKTAAAAEQVMVETSARKTTTAETTTTTTSANNSNNSTLSSTKSTSHETSSSSSSATSPTSDNRSGSNNSVASRRQQLPVAAVGAGVRPAAVAVAAAASGNNNNNNNTATTKRSSTDPSATSDETDESGYEQGDDSVDSSTPRHFKLSASTVAARKRQTNDSMSSSSSTSSGAGSPGQSVSRRVGGVVFGEQVSGNKRPPLNAAAKSNLAAAATREVKSDVNSRLLSLIGANSPGNGSVSNNVIVNREEDFETSLIRDVYSEITKLHAKFAVTSGSAEDLMSSNSSNDEGSASSDRSMNPMMNEDDCDGESITAPGEQPMYSNLKSVSSRSSEHLRQRHHHLLGHQLDDYEDQLENRPHNKQLRQQQQPNNSIKFNQSKPQLSSSYNQLHQHDLISNNQRNTSANNNHSYSQNQFDYLSSCQTPLRTGPLIPIPECGELAPAFNPKQFVKTPVTHNSNNNNSVNGRQVASNSSLISHNREAKTNGHRDERLDMRKNVQKPQVSAALKSRLPTNHYVINDVQYAKISRNIRSNLESCL